MADQNNIAHEVSDSLYTRLANVVAVDSRLNFYHVSTPPTKSDPLFAPAPGEKQQRTYRESQFLTVSVHRPDSADKQEVLVYAIEILIYSTKTLTTVFVSKADSTGYINLLNPSHSRAPSPIRLITSTFISWLADNRQRPGIRLVVSLFARAQDQYLFPGSVENPGKHVLDDRQLVKWWCKTLDPVLRRPLGETCDDSETTAQAHVIVPGFDKHETSAFFPSSYRTDAADTPKWRHGHPLRDIAPNPTAPPRCLVAHFPDDPKARYLDELDNELSDKSSSQALFSPSKKGNGMWKSIKTLDQFWDTMAFRQECCSGRLVGFIWLVFTPSEPVEFQGPSSRGSQGSLSPLGQVSQDLPSISSMLSAPRGTTTSLRKPARRKKLTGPIIPRQPRIKSSSSNVSSTSQPDESSCYRWSEEGRGRVVLDHASYLRVHDLLLRLDFSNADAAAKSTHRWISEVNAIGGTSTGWGKAVDGHLAHPVPAAESTIASNGS